MNQTPFLPVTADVRRLILHFQIAGDFTVKRAEARAPERGVHAASTSLSQAHPKIIFDNHFSQSLVTSAATKF
jgi:hypothetical protein